MIRRHWIAVGVLAAALALPVAAEADPLRGRWEGASENGTRIAFVVGVIKRHLVVADPVMSCPEGERSSGFNLSVDTFGRGDWSATHSRGRERVFTPIFGNGRFGGPEGDLAAPWRSPGLAPHDLAGRLGRSSGWAAKTFGGVCDDNSRIEVHHVDGSVRGDGIYTYLGTYLTQGTLSVFGGGALIDFDGNFGGPPEPRITEQLGPVAGLEACAIYWGPSLNGKADGSFSASINAPSVLAPIHYIDIDGNFTGTDTLSGTYTGFDSFEGQTRCPLRGVFTAKRTLVPEPKLYLRAPAGQGPSKPKEKKPRHCQLTDSVVPVRLSRERYPAVLRHIRRAIRAGWPKILQLNRDGADARRRKALRGVPTKPGKDRDEYPPASLRGRGKGLTRGRDPRGWRAHVAYVPASQNRGAGSVQRHALKAYCDGQRVRFVAKR